MQCGLRAAFVRDVMKNHHRAEHCPGGILDGRRAVFDEDFPAIPGNQCGVIGKRDCHALAQDGNHGIGRRLAGLFVDDNEDLRQRPAGRFSGSPPGHHFSHWIEKSYDAAGIRRYDGIAYARKRDAEPLALLVEVFRLTLKRLFGFNQFLLRAAPGAQDALRIF